MKPASKAAKPAPAKPAAKPTEERIKPEFLPADLGGGDIHFLKRGDYAKRTAETFALKHKADIKKDHVTQAIDALDGGLEELTGENPEEFVKLFDVVKEDYKAGVQKVLEDRQAEADKKAQEEQEAKDKKDKEEKLFLQIKSENPDLGSLVGKFDTGNMDRFIATADVSDAELLGALNTGMKINSRLASAPLRVSTATLPALSSDSKNAAISAPAAGARRSTTAWTPRAPTRPCRTVPRS